MLSPSQAKPSCADGRGHPVPHASYFCADSELEEGKGSWHQMQLYAECGRRSGLEWQGEVALQIYSQSSPDTSAR